MSDRIAIMADGRIQQLGTPSEVYMRPQNRFVAGFFGESNFLSVDVEATGDRAVLRPHAMADTQLYATLRGPLDGTSFLGMVRPEAIEISDSPDPAFENNLSGTVELQDFLGASLRLTIRTGAGAIAVRTSRLATAAALKPGAPVWLNWHADETAVFATDS
jgi:ABC-type Fe3+/spermidine/putrescine transport system ATPase subunit